MDKAFLGVLALAVVFFGFALTQTLNNNAGQAQATAPSAAQAYAAPAGAPVGVQDVYIKALGTGSYDHPYVKVKAGQPVRLHFTASPDAGCGHTLVMRNFGVQLRVSGSEEQVAQFTPPAGKYEYSCSMRMFRGTLEAT